jgi:hypothetical protein
MMGLAFLFGILFCLEVFVFQWTVNDLRYDSTESSVLCRFEATASAAYRWVFGVAAMVVEQCEHS